MSEYEPKQPEEDFDRSRNWRSRGAARTNISVPMKNKYGLSRPECEGSEELDAEHLQHKYERVESL